MVNHVTFSWNIAGSMRGPFNPSGYGSSVLPFIFLRRFDALLAGTKAEVLNVAHSTAGRRTRCPGVEARTSSSHRGASCLVRCQLTGNGDGR